MSSHHHGPLEFKSHSFHAQHNDIGQSLFYLLKQGKVVPPFVVIFTIIYTCDWNVELVLLATQSLALLFSGY